jgi:hypothetical protein
MECRRPRWPCVFHVASTKAEEGGASRPAVAAAAGAPAASAGGRGAAAAPAETAAATGMGAGPGPVALGRGAVAAAPRGGRAAGETAARAAQAAGAGSGPGACTAKSADIGARSASAKAGQLTESRGGEPAHEGEGSVTPRRRKRAARRSRGRGRAGSKGGRAQEQKWVPASLPVEFECSRMGGQRASAPGVGRRQSCATAAGRSSAEISWRLERRSTEAVDSVVPASAEDQQAPAEDAREGVQVRIFSPAWPARGRGGTGETRSKARGEVLGVVAA